MNSHLTEDFVGRFRRLPQRIQDLARKNYRLWKRDTAHPSLDFKRVSQRSPIFSVRVGIGWRAVGVQREETMMGIFAYPPEKVYSREISKDYLRPYSDA